MNDEQLLRYNRQIMLAEIDIAGQQTLIDSTVMVIGVGGLGSPVSLYLAAAGVGHLILVDDDCVDLSNLQRQIAHDTPSIGQLKVDSAKARIAALNPDVRTTCISHRLDGDSLAALLVPVDVVVDCTDNFATRFTINDACLATTTRLVSGAAVQLQGQLMVVDPTRADSPCYRCLYHDGDDTQMSCAENGVAAPVVGIIGTLQALETLKLLVGFGETLVGRVLVFDGKLMDWRTLRLTRDPACRSCGKSS